MFSYISRKSLPKGTGFTAFKHLLNAMLGRALSVGILPSHWKTRAKYAFIPSLQLKPSLKRIESEGKLCADSLNSAACVALHLGCIKVSPDLFSSLALRRLYALRCKTYRLSLDIKKLKKLCWRLTWLIKKIKLNYVKLGNLSVNF